MSANSRFNYKLKKNKFQLCFNWKFGWTLNPLPTPSIQEGERWCTLCFMCLTVEIPNDMAGEELPSKLFSFHKRWGFFLVYSLMTKYSSFSVKLKNASMYGTVRTVCWRKHGFLSYFYIQNLEKYQLCKGICSLKFLIYSWKLIYWNNYIPFHFLGNY